jgi:glycosyltransferase involved in cell wall biosynthesis
MDYPLVSVCIPAFNAGGTIGATLDSILRQDYPSCEIVVSDNHSTDATRKIILTYGARGVRYCMPGARPEWAEGIPDYIGAYVNANYVLSQGQGDFLCLYHADDVYQPDIICKQVELMQANPHVGAVFTMLRNIGGDGQPIRVGSTRLPPELRGQQCFDFETLFNAILTHFNFLPAPSVMLRRSALEVVGGFNEQQWRTSADLELWLRIAGRYAIGIIDEPLLNYRISQKQFGAEYNKLRTTLADFFLVMDYFLAQPEVRQIAKPHTLAVYEMRRSVDQLLCAMNLMARGQVAGAQTRLSAALRWRHFVTARKHSRQLMRLLAGVGLFVSTWVGLGELAGRGLYQAYQWNLRQRQKPLREGF